MSPYRWNARPPIASEPGIDLDAYEVKLRHNTAMWENVRAVVVVLGYGVLGLFFMVAVIATIASTAEDQKKCERRGGVLVEGRCLKEIP